MNSRATRVETFEVCVHTHVALRKFIMRVLASQLHFLTNRNAGLTVPPLSWPVDCIKIGVHVEHPSGPTVHSRYCGNGSSSGITLSSTIIPNESPSLEMLNYALSPRLSVNTLILLLLKK